MMDPIPLDADLVNRFKDKTMAVVGYETNQAIFLSYVYSATFLNETYLSAFRL